MTDNIARILANAKRVFKTKDNNLKYIVTANDENGIETDYTFNFGNNKITVKYTIVDENGVKVISNNHKYDEYLFLSVLANYNILLGNDINVFNNTINLALNNIPAIVFSNSVFKTKGKRRGDDDDEEEEIYDGDKYIDKFIDYNNSNILINSANYFTFLKITAEAGNLQIFTYLGNTYKEYMSDLTEEQMAILIYTVAHKRNLEFILKMSDLNFTFGFEVLKLAVGNNDCEILEHLRYNECIDINAVNIDNETILDYAFGKNTNIKMVEFLIDHNIKILNGYYIIKYIKENPKIIESLFRRDDIIDILKIRDFNGCSVAHEIARNENFEIVKLLFKIDDVKNILNIQNKSGSSVAHEIARNENFEIVKLLFKRDDIKNILDIRDFSGWSVAHNIAKYGNPEMVKFLFERDGIDDILKISDEYSCSVAHVIARNKNLKIVKLLFGRKDIDYILRFKDCIGWTVAHVVAGNENPEIVKLLFERDGINDILKIFNKYDWTAAHHILSNVHDWTVAHEIARNKNPEIVKLLLERDGINDILRMSDEYGLLVAHLIAKNKNLEIVKLLFERDDIDDILKISNEYGRSVAHVVAENENPEVVKLLFERDDIKDILEIRDHNNWSVAHIIAENENPEIVELLFERDDIKDILEIRGHNNWSVAHIIARNKNPEVVKLLLNRKDIKLERKVFNLIKENFTNNEEIKNLLLTRELFSANKATEEVSVTTKNETPEEINTSKECTIC